MKLSNFLFQIEYAVQQDAVGLSQVRAGGGREDPGVLHQTT